VDSADFDVLQGVIADHPFVNQSVEVVGGFSKRPAVADWLGIDGDPVCDYILVAKAAFTASWKAVSGKGPS
jgi:hypothetical protein